MTHKTKDGIEVEQRKSGSHPPDFGGMQCGLRTYIRIGPDWHFWDDRPIKLHKFWEYVESEMFTAQELLDFAGQQLEKQGG